jgi:hypothetical protein
MYDIITAIFELVGKQVYVDENLLSRDSFIGTIDKIEIRCSSHCTLFLAGSNPKQPLVELNISRWELQQLANNWKISRNNHEIYLKSN